MRGIDLTLKRGERLGVVGRNGAGKTTMLKLITQNVAPTEGTVEVNGQVQALLTAGAGFHPEFTGYENIRAALTYQGLDGRQVAEAVADIAEFTELGDFLEQPFRTYSAGMQARLAFATATVVRPETLIIDEMLSAGDAYFLGKSTERVRGLVDSGASVLLVSHSPDQILMFCEESIWLDRGRIVERGPSLEVIKAYEQFTRTIEERRIRARNERLRSGQPVARDRDEPETLVMRLAVSGEQGSVDVRELALLEDEPAARDAARRRRAGRRSRATAPTSASRAATGRRRSSTTATHGGLLGPRPAAPAVGSAQFRVYALPPTRRTRHSSATAPRTTGKRYSRSGATRSWSRKPSSRPATTAGARRGFRCGRRCTSALARRARTAGASARGRPAGLARGRCGSRT